MAKNTIIFIRSQTSDLWWETSDLKKIICSFSKKLKSDLKMGRCPKVKNGGKRGKRALAIIRGDSGPTPVARGGSGAKAPPLVACPYWKVVDRHLLRLLITCIVVYKSLAVNSDIRENWSHGRP